MDDIVSFFTSREHLEGLAQAFLGSLAIAGLAWLMWRAIQDEKSKSRKARNVPPPPAQQGAGEHYKFSCPHCGQHIAATYADVGGTGVCQSCGREFTVPQPAPKSAEIDELLERTRAPKAMQHYEFAHYALRQVAFADPGEIVGCLHSPDGRALIRNLWKQVCARWPEPTGITAEMIKVRTYRVGLFPCAVIEMPPPSQNTEAYFVALVYRKWKMHGAEVTAVPALSYYTLEKGQGDFGETTVFCEWTENGSHLNFGDGPAPVAELFIETVSKRVLATI